MKIFYVFVVLTMIWSGDCLAQTAMPQVEIAALPAYPRLPSGGREQGEVQVEVSIRPNGEVATAKAIAGPERLRVVAEKAAAQWRFARSQRSIEKFKVIFAFILKPGIGESPTVASSFRPPDRVELYAEPKEIVTIQDPPMIDVEKAVKSKP
jgi:hypothetical protein